MATTQRYLHLAGVVFRDEADALERRLGLSTAFSTNLSAPENTERDPEPPGDTEREPPDVV
jgi:hypothetical protein